MSVLKPGKAQELVENIQPFQNAPIISCVHCLFLLWSVASSGRLLNVTFSVENSRALSVKFILPPLFFYFVQWHAGTRSHVGNPCVMDLFYQFHVICGQEFKAFFLRLRWSVQSVFPSSRLRLCVLRCECDFYFLSLSSGEIFCSLNLPLPPFHCQYFYFFNL